MKTRVPGDICLEVVPGSAKGYAVGDAEPTATGLLGSRLTTVDCPLALLEGRTFQVHVLSEGKLKLVPVEMVEPDLHCPVIIGGERCGERAGHSGKHCWGNGD